MAVAGGTGSLRAELAQAQGLRKLWLVLSAAVAAALGALPHVLHHAGPLAGAVLFAGVGGSLLFGALGLVAALPLLVRLYRRTGGLRVPAGVLALFAAVFAIATFVVGPLIGGDEQSASAPPSSEPVPAPPQEGHGAHH